MNAVVETPNCVNGSVGQEVFLAAAKILKSDLSEGAKIAALATLLTGAKTAREIAKATNRPVRSVERHYAELRTSDYADLRISTTQICVPTYADLRSPEPRAPARIDSPFGRDSLPKLLKEDSRLESEDRLNPTTTVARSDSFLPAEEKILIVGKVRLSLEAIDVEAELAGLDKDRARKAVRAMALDWVARNDVPNYPMAVVRGHLARMGSTSRLQRDKALEWGMGRG